MEEQLQSGDKAYDFYDKVVLTGLLCGFLELRPAVPGAYDEEDVQRARRMLAVTETREALEASGLFTGVSDSTWELARRSRAYAEEILRAAKTTSVGA